MTITEAMQARHNGRQYTDKPLDVDVIAALNEAIDICNRPLDFTHSSNSPLSVNSLCILPSLQ